jgi:hypothetical protein
MTMDLGPVAPVARLRLVACSDEPGAGPMTLPACSLCLRVLRGPGWVPAEQAIRELRSFECDAPPRLLPGLCAPCVESINGRRGRAPEPLAA